LKVKGNNYLKKEEMNKYKIRMRSGEREKVMRKKTVNRWRRRRNQRRKGREDKGGEDVEGG
jgi:hypothetical protein